MEGKEKGIVASGKWQERPTKSADRKGREEGAEDARKTTRSKHKMRKRKERGEDKYVRTTTDTARPTQ